MQAITWVVLFLSLLGLYFSMIKNLYGTLIWIVAYAAWSVIDFMKGLPAEGVFFLLIVGFQSWAWWNDPARRGTKKS